MSLKDKLRKWLGVENDEQRMERAIKVEEEKSKLPPRERYAGMKCPAGRHEPCADHAYDAIPAHDQEVAWLDERTARCPFPGCSWGREWPVAAVELYEDKPHRCPKCGGSLMRDTRIDDGTATVSYRCFGMTEEIWRKAWPTATPPNPLPPSCGWNGLESDYGKTWR